jgi:hypothetical protein
MELTDTSDKTIINVVEQFDYSTQNDTYNEKFKNWRKNKQNPYAFNFKLNRNESIFVEGKGFETKSAASAEQDCIGKIMNIAGIAMLMWIVIDNIISKIVVSIFDTLGFNIHTSFFSTGLFGGSTEIITAIIIIGSIKMLVPLIYLHIKLKMPRQLEHMSTLNHASDLISAICMTMAISAVTSLPNIYSNRTWQIFNYFRSINADISVWDQEEFVIYIIFDIIIISTLTELLFRGAIFSALRQFGDKYAIIITSAMAGFLVQDFREFPAAVLISAVASVAMLRSGTIFTAIFVQALFKMYRLALVLLEENSKDTVFLKRNSFILVVFVIGTAGVFLMYMLKDNKNSKLAVYKSDISFKERMNMTCKSFPVPAVICVCLLSAFIKLVF